MQQNIIVTQTTAEIKTIAKQRLNGRWKTVVLAAFLVSMVTTVPNMLITYLFDSYVAETMIQVYAFIVGAPLTLGLVMFRLKVFRRMDVSIGEVFYGFEKLPKALGLQFMVGLFSFLWMLPVVIVITVIITFASFSAAGTGTAVFIVILAFAAFIPLAIFLMRYSLCFYVLADDTEKGVFQWIDESKWYMNGNKLKLFLLYLSFIGWSLLILLGTWILMFFVALIGFSMGMGAMMFLTIVAMVPPFIAYVFLIVYMEMSVTAFYELATGHLNPTDAFSPMGGYYPYPGGNPPGGNYPGGGYPGSGYPGGGYPGGGNQNQTQGFGNYPPVDHNQHPESQQQSGNPFGDVNDLGGGFSGNQSPPDFSGSNPFGNSQFGGAQPNSLFGDQPNDLSGPQTGGGEGSGDSQAESLGGIGSFGDSKAEDPGGFGNFGDSQPGDLGSLGGFEEPKQDHLGGFGGFGEVQSEQQSLDEGFRSPGDGVEPSSSLWSTPPAPDQSPAPFEPADGDQKDPESSAFGQFGFGSGPVSGGFGSGEGDRQKPENPGGYRGYKPPGEKEEDTKDNDPEF